MREQQQKEREQRKKMRKEEEERKKLKQQKEAKEIASKNSAKSVSNNGASKPIESQRQASVHSTTQTKSAAPKSNASATLNKRGWESLPGKNSNTEPAKSIDNQFWWFQTPLRHFESELGVNSIKALESRHHSGKGKGYDSLSSTLDLLDMTPEEVGQIVRSKKAAGSKIQRFVGMIPKPIIYCNVQPVTSNVLKFQIELIPDFEWQGRWHGGAGKPHFLFYYKMNF